MCKVPALIDSDISPKAFRKNWARLIQKIYIDIDNKTRFRYLDDYCWRLTGVSIKHG